jgi:hypothetical protein
MRINHVFMFLHRPSATTTIIGRAGARKHAFEDAPELKQHSPVAAAPASAAAPSTSPGPPAAPAGIIESLCMHLPRHGDSIIVCDCCLPAPPAAPAAPAPPAEAGAVLARPQALPVLLLRLAIEHLDLLSRHVSILEIS